MRHPCQRFAEVCLWVLFIAPVAFLGCGSKPQPIVTQPPISNAKFAYVANQGSNSISMFTVSQAGVWTAATPATIEIGVQPEILVADPLGSYLHVVSSGGGPVSNFAIDPTTGILTATDAVSTVPVPETADPSSKPGKFDSLVDQAGGGPYAVDPSGKLVYIADKDGKSVTSYAVTPNGKLSLQSVFPTGLSPISIALIPRESGF